MRKDNQQWAPGSWVCESTELLHDRKCQESINVADAVDEVDGIISRMVETARIQK